MTTIQKESMKAIMKFIMSNAKLRKAYIESDDIKIRLGVDDEDFNNGYMSVSISETYQIEINNYNHKRICFWDWSKKEGNRLTNHLFN